MIFYDLERLYYIMWWSVYWRMKMRFSMETIQRVAVIKSNCFYLNLISLLDSFLLYNIFGSLN